MTKKQNKKEKKIKENKIKRNRVVRGRGEEEEEGKIRTDTSGLSNNSQVLFELGLELFEVELAKQGDAWCWQHVYDIEISLFYHCCKILEERLSKKGRG